MADVSDVQMEPEWVVAVGDGLHERRRAFRVEAARVIFQPRPHRTQRYEMADVQRVDEVLPDVFIAVSRQAADESFYGVAPFYTDAENISSIARLKAVTVSSSSFSENARRITTPV